MLYGVLKLVNNKFIIITTAYNVGGWIDKTIESIANQDHDNYLHIIVNDNSNDNTVKVINELKHDKLVMLDNTNNGSQCKAFLCAWDWVIRNDFNDEVIIVEVDGDDWLPDSNILGYLNKIYQNNKIWMTSGQYLIYPQMKNGGHKVAWEQWVDVNIDNENLYRKVAFPYSHLKTYKLHLLNKIRREDLINPETNDYFDCIFDHVLCLPMVEMAGRDRIHVCERDTYVLNRSEGLGNESSVNVAKQKQTEQIVRNKLRYDRI